MSRKFLTPIVLPADPAAAMEAATKQYVDSKASGGASEVEIGPSDPIGTNASAELWYDTDAPTVMDNDMRWYTAWGTIGPQVVNSTTFNTTAPHTTGQSTGLTITVNETAGRRLAIRTQLNLYPSGGVQAISVTLQRNGVGIDTWFVPGESMGAGASFPLSRTTTYVTTTTGIGTYTVYMSAASVNTAVSDFSGRSIVVDDCGPSSGAIPVMPPSSDARWNTAWGIIAIATPYGAGISVPAQPTVTRVTNTLTVFLQAGRRYRVVNVCRAISSPSGQSTMQFQLWDNGANSGGMDYWHQAPVGNYDNARAETIFAGDDRYHNYDVRIGSATYAISVYSDLAVHAFYVEDVGPVAGAAPVINPVVPWANATLLNGWGNLGAPWALTQYRRIGDIVYIRGHVSNATAPPAAGAQAIFTLPPGYRPPAYEIFGQNCGGTPPGYGDAIVRVQVMSDTGNVEVLRANTTTQNPQSYLSLTNMQFSVI